MQQIIKHYVCSITNNHITLKEWWVLQDINTQEYSIIAKLLQNNVAARHKYTVPEFIATWEVTKKLINLPVQHHITVDTLSSLLTQVNITNAATVGVHMLQILSKHGYNITKHEHI
jgi:hypothetical protein